MTFVQPIKDRKQLEVFKTVLKNRSLMYYLLFVIGINSGLRVGDILRLRVSDIVANDKGMFRKHISIVEEKTDKPRLIAINKLNFGKHIDDWVFFVVL